MNEFENHPTSFEQARKLAGMEIYLSKLEEKSIFLEIQPNIFSMSGRVYLITTKEGKTRQVIVPHGDEKN